MISIGNMQSHIPFFLRGFSESSSLGVGGGRSLCSSSPRTFGRDGPCLLRCDAPKGLFQGSLRPRLRPRALSLSPRVITRDSDRDHDLDHDLDRVLVSHYIALHTCTESKESPPNMDRFDSFSQSHYPRKARILKSPIHSDFMY